MNAKTKKLIEKLQEEIRYHRKKYFDEDSPIISDAEYDVLVDQLRTYQKRYPDLAKEEIGYRSEGSSVTHIHPMLSLRSTRNLMDAASIFTRYSCDISCEPKIDGLSAELIYRGRQLVSASTRGDGVVGENITQNVVGLGNLSGMPLRDNRNIEIYGEIYLRKDHFNKINRDRSRLGKTIYASPRNAAAGIVRSSESQKYLQYLSFFPYTVYGIGATTQKECFEWLDSECFDTLPDFREIISNNNSFDDYHNKMLELRKKLPFEIDGLVFKVNDLGLQDKMGVAFTHPLWAIAFKFNPTRSYTRLLDVVFQVGKSGVIAPVAILDPIRINNSMVSRASLANKEMIESKDIRINDMVAVELANDVIPYIAEVDPDEKRSGKEIEIVFPATCPCCNSYLRESGPHMVCLNGQCPDQLIGRLDAAFSRKGFNVKGLGRAMITQLVETGTVREISDIFMLDTDRSKMQLLEWGERTMDNLSVEIDDARLIRLDKFIFALGIPDVSIATATKLAERYQTIENLVGSINLDGVAKLSNTSTETLRIINDYFTNQNNLNAIERFRLNGVVVDKYTTKAPTDTIVITGGLKIPRTDVEEIVRRNGYKPSDRVSKSTKFLVEGSNPSIKKVRQAKQLNIPILNESAFFYNFDKGR